MVKERTSVVIAVIAVVCLLTLLIILFAVLGRGEPPVIQGTQKMIVLYMDDDIQAALTGGVYAVDQEGNTLPVEIAVYDESGNEVPEYQPGTYRVVYRCRSAEEAESVLVLYPEDKEPPVITGARDLTVTVGEAISYRDGITVTDNMDEMVLLQIDAGLVNLEQAGTYSVTYSAEDSRGNRTEITITVLVEEPPEYPPDEEPSEPGNSTVEREALDNLAAGILDQITTSGMTQKQIARAIFDYVHGKIRYVNTSDQSDWVTGAYVGFTQGRGDCFNYFACSKELLTLAGIPNIDLSRVGGNSDHYWQLVNVGDGWYHFDACPHPNSHPITSFLLTETEVRQYSALFSGIWLNYYVYDYDACPVTAVGTPEEDIRQTGQPQAEEPPPAPERPGETPGQEPSISEAQ